MPGARWRVWFGLSGRGSGKGEGVVALGEGKVEGKKVMFRDRGAKRTRPSSRLAALAGGVAPQHKISTSSFRISKVPTLKEATGEQALLGSKPRAWERKKRFGEPLC